MSAFDALVLSAVAVGPWVFRIQNSHSGKARAVQNSGTKLVKSGYRLFFGLVAHLGINNDLAQLNLGSDQRQGIKGHFAYHVFHFHGGNLYLLGNGALHALCGELVLHQGPHFFFDFKDGLLVVFGQLAFAPNLGHQLLKSPGYVVVNLTFFDNYRINGRMVNQELLENQLLKNFAFASILTLALKGFAHDKYIRLKDDLIAYHRNHSVGQHGLCKNLCQGACKEGCSKN